MKHLLSILSLTLITCFAFGQAGRMVINNNGYVVIDNSAFVVLDNANPDAITVLGTGANIRSENENDVIKWEIGTTIGTYVIPWTTATNVKIPLTINKTTAGTGATAEFILSTWETNDNNLPIPSAVNNMNYNSVDKSLYVADRFWHIDARSYSTKPSVTLSIAYNAAANEIGPGNTIIEANLLAQRFNTGLNNWESYLLFGTNNAAADRVDNIVVTPANFYEDWILVDNTNPLPVILTAFNANCNSNTVELSWTTESEINNDYFIVEKSFDAVTFFELTKVYGNGSSSVMNHYSAFDSNPSSGVTYYRLKQVDFDGAISYHNIVSTNCNANGFNVNQIILNNNALSFNVATTLNENLMVYFYDYRGRLIANKPITVVEGNNIVKLNNLELSTGIYMLSIIGEQNSYATKLLNRKD
jgi:hypothetical protein